MLDTRLRCLTIHNPLHCVPQKTCWIVSAALLFTRYSCLLCLRRTNSCPSILLLLLLLCSVFSAFGFAHWRELNAQCYLRFDIHSCCSCWRCCCCCIMSNVRLRFSMRLSLFITLFILNSIEFNAKFQRPLHEAENVYSITPMEYSHWSSKRSLWLLYCFIDRCLISW